MISWSYYGERCWSALFGTKTAIFYKLIFLSCVVLGAVLKLDNVVDFSDLMILGMSFPNILGVYILSGHVSRSLKDYWTRYRTGQMQPER